MLGITVPERTEEVTADPVEYSVGLGGVVLPVVVATLPVEHRPGES